MTPDDKNLDEVLRSHFMATAEDDAAAARVLRSLSAKPLPRQRGSWNWPAALLRWDMAPAWPRVAALAACAALGFVVGIAGLDAKVDDAAATTMAANDPPPLFTGSDPLTGLRP